VRNALGERSKYLSKAFPGQKEMNRLTLQSAKCRTKDKMPKLNP
jgi:hypothetical protein